MFQNRAFSILTWSNTRLASLRSPQFVYMSASFEPMLESTTTPLRRIKESTSLPCLSDLVSAQSWRTEHSVLGSISYFWDTRRSFAMFSRSPDSQSLRNRVFASVKVWGGSLCSIEAVLNDALLKIESFRTLVTLAVSLWVWERREGTKLKLEEDKFADNIAMSYLTLLMRWETAGKLVWDNRLL